MILNKKQSSDNSAGLRALSEKVDKLEAERKSLYSIIDKLSDCIEETNRRFDGIISQIETLENRITDMEIKYDNYISKNLEEEEVNETS